MAHCWGIQSVEATFKYFHNIHQYFVSTTIIKGCYCCSCTTLHWWLSTIYAIYSVCQVAAKVLYVFSSNHASLPVYACVAQTNKGLSLTFNQPVIKFHINRCFLVESKNHHCKYCTRASLQTRIWSRNYVKQMICQKTIGHGLQQTSSAERDHRPYICGYALCSSIGLMKWLYDQSIHCLPVLIINGNIYGCFDLTWSAMFIDLVTRLWKWPERIKVPCPQPLPSILVVQIDCLL